MGSRWIRAKYQPNKPLYEGQSKVTASREHMELSREAAREGMVLLKNEKKLLPFPKNARLALFGKGVFDYVKGGGGSGDVTVSHVYHLYDGFKMCGYPVQIYEPLCDYYREYVGEQYAKGALPGLFAEPKLSDKLLKDAREYTDTAVIVISRFSGEGWDRRSVRYEGQLEPEACQSKISENIFQNSDYYLSEEEEEMIRLVTSAFPKTAVVLNTGGIVDTSWFAHDPAISSVLLAWQGGMEGGLAAAELLMGIESPSGRLPDTFASDIDDYPSSAHFHDSPEYVDYTEDIYVGYRYFETIKGEKNKVNYPFGYGLSYSRFAAETVWAGERENHIYVTVKVTNLGRIPAKEVVQVYFQAPQGLLGKPARQLISFEKTKKMEPSESQILTLSFPVWSMASYDDLGKIKKSAYVLEEGSYFFYVGQNVRDAEEISYQWQAKEDIVVLQLEEKCPPRQLKSRLLADGSYEDLPLRETLDPMENVLEWSEEETEGVIPAVRGRKPAVINPEAEKGKIFFQDVAEGKAPLEEFLAQLTDEEISELLGGQPNTGVGNTFGWGNVEKYGVPNLMTADGPAGLRILPECEIYTTAWPCAVLLASTWNRELVKRIGAAGAEEVKENNLYIWLAPAINIHRNPLCGRNFEYYSEDPVLAGEMAAAMVEGIQSVGVGAAAKHFCCNNKETNRKNSDSRVSERALREIYLKAFEIVVRKANPWAIMSSYNLINGCRSSENKDLLTGILRDEWGYEGAVTSDWYTKGEHYKEVLAGNDIKMGCGYPKRLLMAIEKGALTRKDMERSAYRILQLIKKAD